MMVARTGYIDADVIIEGALEETRTFVTYDDGTDLEFGGTFTLELWLDSLKDDVEQAGDIVAEVYILEHGHEMSEDDCACAQYVTDGGPAYVFGRGEDR